MSSIWNKRTSAKTVELREKDAFYKQIAWEKKQQQIKEEKKRVDALNLTSEESYPSLSRVKPTTNPSLPPVTVPFAKIVDTNDGSKSTSYYPPQKTFQLPYIHKEPSWNNDGEIVDGYEYNTSDEYKYLEETTGIKVCDTDTWDETRSKEYL